MSKSLVYMETKEKRRNYVKSVGSGQITFGEKAEAQALSDTNADRIKTFLIKNLGNGFVEKDDR